MWRRPGGGGRRRGRRRPDDEDGRGSRQQLHGEEDDGVLIDATDGGASEDGFAVVEREGDEEEEDKNRHRRRRRPGSSWHGVARLVSVVASIAPRIRLRCRCPRPSWAAASLASRQALALPARSKFALLLSVLLSLHLVRIAVLRPLSHLLLGPTGSTQGGLLGIFVDYQLRLYLVRRTMRSRDEEWRRLGVPVLPEPPPVFGGRSTFPVLPNGALGEMLRREVARERAVRELELEAERYDEGCRRSGEAAAAQMTATEEEGVEGTVPAVILRPNNLGPWSQRPYHLSALKSVTFEEDERRALVRERCPVVGDAYSSLGSSGASSGAQIHRAVDLWALCAIWHYGGVYLGEGMSEVDLRAEWSEAASAVGLIEQQSRDDPGKAKGRTVGALTSEGGRSCPPSRGFAVLSGRSDPSADSDSFSDARLKVLAATPRHPSLLCAMHSVAAEHSAEGSFSKGVVAAALWGSKRAQSNKSSWTRVRSACVPGDTAAECCGNSKKKEVSASELAADRQSTHSSHVGSTYYVRTDERPKEQPRSGESSSPLPVTVTITERGGTAPPARTSKVSLLSQMQHRGGGSGGPSWLCDRCLRSPLWGTFERCRSMCADGYYGAVCVTSSAEEQEKEIIVDVLVQRSRPDGDKSAHRSLEEGRRQQHRMIPRIIHQTYSEDITAAKYPHLKRLQNSWRNSGWEYRFYTDDDAREYVSAHYPRRFVDAFDALLPGAYKADFFRYLVLLRDGGIYADVDVLLTAGNLDEAISPTTSFVVPRDRVAEYALNGTYCLWNGLLGSAPGHPFMVRAVERAINLIEARADLFDMEREACRGREDDGGGRTMEDWKVRAEPGLLLSGPCALGVAVNEALGNDPLAAFDVGWLETADVSRAPLRSDDADGSATEDGAGIRGDALILVADKRDLGAQRFSDPERNLVIASTDMAGLMKSPLEPQLSLSASTLGVPGDTMGSVRSKAGQKESPHYSAAAKGQWLWGSEGVYADVMVTNERITIHVSTA